MLWAISVHFDKYLVDRFFKDTNVAVLLLFTALIGVLMLPFIWCLEPGVIHHDLGSIALMTLSGILYLSGMLLYLKSLQGEEASVVAPFFQAGPLFSYVLAYLVLGETLTPQQMTGGALVVIGTLFVSLRFGQNAQRFKARLAVRMLGCAFIMALSGLIFKAFVLKVEFWTTIFWMFIGEAIVGAVLLLMPPFRRQFMVLLRKNTAALLSINGANEVINLSGSLGNRYALLFAPLSIVQAIGSTTTLFVFAFGVLLSVFFPKLSREDLSSRELIQKGIAAMLVAVGVALVTR